MTDSTAVIIAVITAGASLFGSGFIARAMVSSLRENLREIFVTKEVHTAENKNLHERIDSQWDSITQHVIAPLKTISDKLEAVMLSQARLEGKHGSSVN
jgi:hypothetical protein